MWQEGAALRSYYYLSAGTNIPAPLLEVCERVEKPNQLEL